MIIYISGPMTGRPEFNRPAFMEASSALEQAGHEVLNPAAMIDHHDDWAWSDYMRCAVTIMMAANAVALLPGWEGSRGALIEKHLAELLGIPAKPIERWVEQ